MFDETCKWTKKNHLVWKTECDHQIGTPRSWEPEGNCMCCKKPVEVVNDGDVVDSVSVRAGAGAL